MPIILVQNETTEGQKYDHWKDIEGEQYHFPNQYKGKVHEGDFFIYYRGVRRAKGKRGIPEYFGYGKIGTIWLDPETETLPKKNWGWFCEIIDYVPFNVPVPAKINEETFEKIYPNQWSVAVRSLSNNIFKDILAAARISYHSTNHETSNSEVNLIPIEEVSPSIVNNGSSIIIPTSKRHNNVPKYTAGVRRSKISKISGDRAEHIVFNLLEVENVSGLKWTSREKLTPGWDIEYIQDNQTIAIEVKGTSGKGFTNVEITSNEWNAAKRLGGQYYLFLVADCLGKYPKVQKIKDPYSLFIMKKIDAQPAVWKLSFQEEI